MLLHLLHSHYSRKDSPCAADDDAVRLRQVRWIVTRVAASPARVRPAKRQRENARIKTDLPRIRRCRWWLRRCQPQTKRVSLCGLRLLLSQIRVSSWLTNTSPARLEQALYLAPLAAPNVQRLVQPVLQTGPPVVQYDVIVAESTLLTSAPPVMHRVTHTDAHVQSRPASPSCKRSASQTSSIWCSWFCQQGRGVEM